MRALVTGGTGFVGANLVRRLLGSGHEVHLLVQPGYQSWRLRGLDDRASIHEGQLDDRDGLTRLMWAVRPTCVFHLAAYGAYPSQRNLATMAATNITGTMALAESCRDARCEVMVNTGSSSEYGALGHAPAETEALRPNSGYAATKAAASLFCGFAARAWGMRIPTLRLYSVYGPFEEPTRLVPRLLVGALRGELPQLAAPDVAHDYVFVDDVCDAYLLAAADRQGQPDAVYNVGSGVQSTLLDVVTAVTEILPIAAQPRWSSMPNREWDTVTWLADSTRIRKELGWEPRWRLRDGLIATLEWLRRDPELLALYRRMSQP